MTFALIVAAVALLVAAYALIQARAAGRRAERLAQSYWDLRYEVGQLRVRIARPDTASGPEADTDAAAAPRSAPTTSFVPLSSLKK